MHIRFRSPGVTWRGAWTLLFAAFVLWLMVGYFVWMVAETRAAHDARRAATEEDLQRHNATLRVRALARETKADRGTLEGLAQKSILEIVGAVEAVAEDADVALTIGQVLGSASPEGEMTARSVSLVVESRGTFSEVVRAVSLLESLPIPSVVSEAQLERVADPSASSASRWRAVVRIRFLTTAEIPS